MITLELKKRFSEQARADHLNRLSAVLTELDMGYGYSQRSEFKTTLDNLVSLLAEIGLYGAAEQARAIFCILSEACSIGELKEALHAKQSLYALEQNYLDRHSRKEVFQAALKLLQQRFDGLGRFDEMWLASQSQAGLSQSMVNSPAGLSPICLPCSQEGIVDFPQSVSISKRVNCLRTDSGFQHKVTERYTPPELIRQLCVQTLPIDPAATSIKPIVDRCHFGVIEDGRFEVLHAIDLMDARQFQYSFEHRSLNCPASAAKELQANWESGINLIGSQTEPQVLVQQPLINCSIKLNAAWEKVADKFQFKSEGFAAVALSADALQWHASVLYKSRRVYFTILPEQDLHLEWNLCQVLAEGLIPVGTPFLIREHKVPLRIHCAAPLAAGQAVLSSSTAYVGYLNLDLLGMVNADTHCIELALSLSHSELNYAWQFADALLGWSSGTWTFLPQARIASWSLTDG